MRKVFVKTKNVKQMVSMLNRLRDRGEGIPGMGLIYGEPGLGKTYAITWWSAQNDGNNEDDNNSDDPWLTIDEVALLLNNKLNAVSVKNVSS